jgi:branched-chain amino acid transport system substrate-binding protein
MMPAALPPMAPERPRAIRDGATSMEAPMLRRMTAPILALAVLSACGGAGSGDPLYLGLAGPLDLSYGKAMHQAARLAAEEINRMGGIAGRPIALVVEDDGADPQRAIEIAGRLRDDPRIVAVVGHVTSGATLAAAEIYNHPTRGVVALSPTASSPLVTNAGPWTFRVCPSDLYQGPVLANWAARRMNRRRVAVLYANDPYGRGLMESFAGAFEQAGGRVSFRDPFLLSQMEEETALDPYLQRAIRSGVDGIMIAGLLDEGEHILRAARRLGYTGPVFGADGLIGLEARGAVAEGVFISAPFLPDRADEAAQRFVTAYEQRFGEGADAYGALTYDAVRVLARALEHILERGGPSSGQPLRTAVRDYLAAIGTDHAPFEGVTGRIVFDANGDVPGKEITVGVVRQGRLRTAGL